MKDQCVEQDVLSLEDIVLGFMRYCQICFEVKDFPLFSDPAWTYFLFCVIKELGHELPRPLDVEFSIDSRGVFVLSAGECENISCALNFTACVDHQTNRMFLDIGGDSWGTKLGRRFPELARDMFVLSRGFRGFAEVGV
jgi:hypothetical protein